MSTTMTENLKPSGSDLPNSEKFDAPDAEVVFQSSDGILFRIHKMNLATCTEGFSPPEHSTFDEIVPLPESSSTLALLFQFIYPQPQPELGAVDFETLALLAEAAEKYRVFPAMNLCTIYMMEHLEDHAEEILLHALKHGVQKLVARAAPLLLDRPLENFLQTLPDRFVIPWVRYHSKWTRVWKLAASSAPASKSMSRSTCYTCNKILHDYVLDIIAKLSADLSVLQDLSAVFKLPTCCPSTTREPLRIWRATLRAEIFLIPTFANIAFPGDTTPSPKEQEKSEYSEEKKSDGELGMKSLQTTNLQTISATGEFLESTSKPGSSDENTYITFVSSDGISFDLRKEAIKAWTKNLLPSQYDQHVQLPEPSTTLELLFRFLRTSPHPDLEAVDFRVLGPLSLAADSYKVYPAIQVCSIRRGQALPHDLINQTSAVMDYALKSNSYDLMNKSAPLLIGQPSVKMVELFKTPSMIVLWVGTRLGKIDEYLEKWDEVVQIALSFSENRKTSQYNFSGTLRRGCSGCKSPLSDTTTIRTMRKLGKGVKSLLNLDDIFGTSDSFCCNTELEDLKRWRARVESAIEGIPSFTSILNPSDLEDNDGDA